MGQSVTTRQKRVTMQHFTHCRPAAQMSLASWRLRSSSITLSNSAAYAGWFSRTSSDTRL